MQPSHVRNHVWHMEHAHEANEIIPSYVKWIRSRGQTKAPSMKESRQVHSDWERKNRKNKMTSIRDWSLKKIYLDKHKTGTFPSSFDAAIIDQAYPPGDLITPHQDIKLMEIYPIFIFYFKKNLRKKGSFSFVISYTRVCHDSTAYLYPVSKSHTTDVVEKRQKIHLNTKPIDIFKIFLCVNYSSHIWLKLMQCEHYGI